MLGNDGRLYDKNFDYDNDGKLNSYERSMYDDSFKSEPISPKQSPFTLLYHCGGIFELLSIIVWLFGFILMVACPPLGAMVILGAIKLSDR